MRKLLRYWKGELGIESISIVLNGSKITESFLRENAAFIDAFAISCYSFDTETNVRIGRGRSGENVEQRAFGSEPCRNFLAHSRTTEERVAAISNFSPETLRKLPTYFGKQDF